MSDPILFVYDPKEIREDLREDSRRAGLVAWALSVVLVAVILVCVGSYLWVKAPINLDVTQEVRR